MACLFDDVIGHHPNQIGYGQFRKVTIIVTVSIAIEVIRIPETECKWRIGSDKFILRFDYSGIGLAEAVGGIANA